MAKPERLRAALKSASSIPPGVRARIMRAPADAAPGAVPVLERFYAALKARGRDFDCPPRACYDAAASSEATLGLLLRTLERFAPEMNLAEGRDARRAWYRLRGGGSSAKVEQEEASRLPPAIWPPAWRPAFERLHRASPKQSTADRYVASLTRCAQELCKFPVQPAPDRFRALLLGEAFRRQGLKPRTIRNYLWAFLRLAQCLDIDAGTLAGVEEAHSVWKRRAARSEKRKDLVLDAFKEEGGSWSSARTRALELVAEAEAAGGSWRADAERLRLQGAVLLLALNTVARTGDIAVWCVGQQLKRRSDGSWSLRYTAQKSGKRMYFSRLWPETCQALDMILLAGRPERMVEARYAALEGMTWMRLGPAPIPAKHPSALVAEILDISSHPLRTLAADVMRRIDPERSVEKTAAWLGHLDDRSQDDYAHAAEGRAATDRWFEARARYR